MTIDQLELDAAIARHEGYERVEPDNIQLKIALGDLYRTAGRYDDAMACYQRCLDLYPAAVSARSRQALTMIATERCADAERALRALLVDDPDSAVLLHNLGVALQGQGNWLEAAESFASAEAKGLFLPGNYQRMALAYLAAGDLQEAKSACERWCRHSASVKDSCEGRGLLAALLLEEGDNKQAEQFARAALQLDPDQTEANIVLGTLRLERHELDAARRHYEKAIARSEHNGRAWLGIGLSYLQDEQFDRADAAIAKAHELDPNNPGIAVTVGWMKLLLTDTAAARSAFEAAIAVNRNFSEAHGGLAVVLAMSGESDDAKRSIDVARRLDGRGFGAEFAQVALLTKQGRADDGAAHFASLLQRPAREGGMTLAEHVKEFAAKRNGLAEASASA